MPTIQIASSGVTRTKTVRDASMQPLWVNRADCDAENNLVFPLNLTNFGTNVMEVWLGTANCTDLTNRANTGLCVHLTDNDVSSLAANITVTIKARDLVEKTFPMADRATLCSTAQTGSAARPVTLYFMLLPSPGAAAQVHLPYSNTQVDLVGPVAPTEVTTGIGETKLVVKWKPNSSTSDPVSGYQLFCEPSSAPGGDCSGTSLKAGDTPALTLGCGDASGPTAADATTSTLLNSARYAIGVSGIDAAGNLGPLSSITCATPQAVTDFYEAYKQAGGTAGGGFCAFTPAHGTPRTMGWGVALGVVVWSLRRGRRTLLGSANSSRTERSGKARSGKARGERPRQRLLQLFTVAVIALGTSFAPRALAFDNYRGARASFGADGGVVEKPVGFELGKSALYELRFGPYAPKIDNEFSGTGPYEQMFGKKKRLLVGFEADWQALKLDRIASLGPGFGIGMTQMSGKAPLTDGSGVSSQENALSILPMYGVGVLRLTVLQDQFRVPLVPYAKAGLGYALWWTTSAGDLARVDGKKGRGSSYGPQWSAGLMLNLGFFDRAGEAGLRTGPEFESAYVFGEWLSSDLKGFGKKTLQVGADTWFLGLALRD